MEKENTRKEKEVESTGVFELPGEPAVIINGVPDALPADISTTICADVTDAELHQSNGLGEWLEGREIRKLFGDQFYSGTVTEFDEETGWYSVVYEDGDSEDLDWNELEELLLPLDINIPLKTLALDVIKKNQKPIHGSGKKVTESRKRQAKKNMGHGKDVKDSGGAKMSFADEPHEVMTVTGAEDHKDLPPAQVFI